MRRTGSEEIGSSKALGRAGMIPGLPRLLLLVIFLVKLQSGGLGSQNTTMPGALCPASSSLLCFIGWSYPQIVLYSRINKREVTLILMTFATSLEPCPFQKDARSFWVPGLGTGYFLLVRFPPTLRLEQSFIHTMQPLQHCGCQQLVMLNVKEVIDDKPDRLL